VTVARGRKAGGEEEAVAGAAAALEALAGGRLDACLVLREGLAPPPLEGARAAAAAGVPGLLPVPGAKHAVTVGTAHGLRVAAFSGRRHLYEGCTPAEVARPVRAAARAGARLLALTNAAGGVAAWCRPGDFLVLEDHLDLGRGDPAAGEEAGAFGPRFQSLADAYDDALADAGLEAARRARVACARGVYAFLRGPAFETRAEVRMLRTLGADVVGMSTVPEVAAGRRLGMRVFALSVVGNRAGVASDGDERVTERVAGRAAAASAVLDAVLAAFAGDGR
jgi:purine-nucleoside phosphorylase